MGNMKSKKEKNCIGKFGTKKMCFTCNHINECIMNVKQRTGKADEK